MSSPFSRFCVGALCLLGLAGCGGGSLVKLQGRLTLDGQALQWNEPTALEVSLVAESSDPMKPGKSYAAEVGPDGTFTVQGSDGRGIPPGTYQFAVTWTGYGPGTKPPAWLKGLDKPATSTLKYEVTADANQKIVIDLTKKTVRRDT